VGNEKRKKAKIFKENFVNSKKGFNFAIQKLKKESSLKYCEVEKGERIPRDNTLRGESEKH